MTDERPPCAGKGFEHHERTVPYGMTLQSSWQCPACDDIGFLGNDTRWLWEKVGAGLLRLKEEALADRATVLLPSQASPGLFGEFMGFPVYRVQGIDKPMIAIPGA